MLAPRRVAKHFCKTPELHSPRTSRFASWWKCNILEGVSKSSCHFMFNLLLIYIYIYMYMSLSGTQSDHSDGFITSFIFESKKLGKHLENTEVLLGVGQFDYQPCQSSRGVERVGPAMKERVAYPLMLRIVDFGQGSLNGTHFGGIKHIVYYIYIYIYIWGISL